MGLGGGGGGEGGEGDGAHARSGNVFRVPYMLMSTKPLAEYKGCAPCWRLHEPWSLPQTPSTLQQLAHTAPPAASPHGSPSEARLAQSTAGWSGHWKTILSTSLPPDGCMLHVSIVA